MHVEEIITMDKSRRLVLPGRIRKAVHVKEPAAFRVEVVGNKLELTPILPPVRAVITRRNGLLVISTDRRGFNAANAVDKLRRERL
jgi:bifunctional DNA-binding transcriptional regulator/antitoxin component of YhaV-PrlF toxin-antitoxin module